MHAPVEALARLSTDSAFQQVIDYWKSELQDIDRQLESAVETHTLFRLQGEAKRLRQQINDSMTAKETLRRIKERKEHPRGSL